MSNFENSGPAFPCETVGADEHGEYRLPWQGMTLRQYAAIKLRVPNSGTDWLDEMIRTSLRDDLAAKAVQAYFTDPNVGFDRESIEAGVGRLVGSPPPCRHCGEKRNEQQGAGSSTNSR